MQIFFHHRERVRHEVEEYGDPEVCDTIGVARVALLPDVVTPPPPTWPTAKAFAFLCVDSTQRSETGQVRGLRWHNRPREREGKECGEADGHGALQRERPREGKGEGRGKVRARRKRKVKGW